MIDIKDGFLPREGQHIIMYFEGGMYTIGWYKSCWTFKGRKLKFCNNKGTPIRQDGVRGWNRIPLSSETLGGTGHHNAELLPEDITCGWKNELSQDGDIIKTIMFKGKTHWRTYSFQDNEFFAMVKMVQKHFSERS